MFMNMITSLKLKPWLCTFSHLYSCFGLNNSFSIKISLYMFKGNWVKHSLLVLVLYMIKMCHAKWVVHFFFRLVWSPCFFLLVMTFSPLLNVYLEWTLAFKCLLFWFSELSPQGPFNHLSRVMFQFLGREASRVNGVCFPHKVLCLAYAYMYNYGRILKKIVFPLVEPPICSMVFSSTFKT